MRNALVRIQVGHLQIVMESEERFSEDTLSNDLASFVIFSWEIIVVSRACSLDYIVKKC